MKPGLKLPRGKRAVLLLAALAAFALLVFSSRWFLGQAGSLREARAALSRASQEAGALAARQAKAEAARQEFLRAAEPLARDAEAGAVLRFLEEAARASGVRVTLAAAEPRLEKAWKGHFRAVPWKLEAVGSGPGVQAFLAGCEALPCPGELRVFSVQADESPGAVPGQVKASCLLLLYSTDPPLREELLPAPAARADVWKPPASWSPPAPAAPEAGGAGAGPAGVSGQEKPAEGSGPR